MTWGKQKSGAQQGWGYWHGAYANWHRDKKDGQHKDNKSLLVPYDQMKVEGGGTQSTEGSQANHLQDAGDGGDGMIRELQTSLNAARKAESRVKKLLADRSQKTTQWESYEKELRSAFLKERKRHQSDLERIEKELRQAVLSQEEARARVRQAAQGSSGSFAVADKEMEAEEPDPWLELTAVHEESPPEDEVLQAVLARAMIGPHHGQGDRVGQDSLTPATPPTRGTPRTPKAAMPKTGGHGIRPPGSRLTPFPPPKRPKLGHELGEEDVLMGHTYAAADPYQSQHNAADSLASPPLGGPKTPKARSNVEHAVKEKAAMPASVRERLEKKRTDKVEASAPASMASIRSDGPLRFQICDDDKDLDPGGVGSEMD